MTGTQTVGDYLTSWIEGRRGELTELTFRQHESNIRCHILPHLGKIKLNALTPQQVQLATARLSSVFAPATVRRSRAVLHAALDDAVEWGLLVRNPSDRAPRVRVPRLEMVVLTFEQVMALVTSTPDVQRQAIWALAATAGMRRGELLGLRWGDIDLDVGTIAVQRTLQRHKGDGLVFQETKTAGSRRAVTITKLAVESLRAHRTAQFRRRLRIGRAWHELDLVFTSAWGTGLEGSHVGALLRRDLQAAGLPSVTLHSLRHSAATMMLALGVHPRIVSEMLGHSRTAVTMDVYSHVLPGLQADAVAALDRRLNAV